MKHISSFLTISIFIICSSLYSQTTQQLRKDNNTIKASPISNKPISPNTEKETQAVKQKSSDSKPSTNHRSINISDNENQSISKTQQALQDEYNKRWNSTCDYEIPEPKNQYKQESNLAENFKANEKLMKQPAANNVLSLNQKQLERKNKADQYEEKILDRLHRQ